MKPNKLDGKRIKLISIDDKFTDLKLGDEGTVTHVDDMGHIHMSWDNGSTLALIPEIDKYEIINEAKKADNKSRRLMLFESFNMNNNLDTLDIGINKIRKLVNATNIIKMSYEVERADFSATLDVFFEDGDNTQGNIYHIYLEENMVEKMPYVSSTKLGDNNINDEDDIQTHFRSVEEIIAYLNTEVNEFIRIEESKRHKKGKRV